MNAITGFERAWVEARTRRLAAAVIDAHTELDRMERAAAPRSSLDRPALAARRDALVERVQDLGAMTALLPRSHVLRMAADHAASTFEQWSSAPAATERAGGLSLVIAIDLLRRALADHARAMRPRASSSRHA